MGLSRNVSEIDGDFCRKSPNFPSLIFCAHAEGFPLELGIGAGVKKLERWGYQADEEVWQLSLAVWIECMNVTDGQTPGHSKDRT